MAKARLAIVPKKPATPVDDVTLPEPVNRVLYDIQQRLYQINATISGIHALAEAKECDSDVRWALEGVLASFQPLLDDDLARIVVTRSITMAAKREVSRGR